MITGVVTADCEATISLGLLDGNGREHDLEAVIDAGFNGFLTLPSPLIERMQ